MEGRAGVVSLVTLLLLALALRWHGFWWDEGQGFHPDERWVISVASRLEWPSSPGEALSLSSPLNPFWDADTQSTRRFAYGHLSIYLIRLLEPLVAPWAPAWSPILDIDQRLTITGRALSIAADLATLLLIWTLARRFGRGAAGVAAGGWAVAWLPIQQAHFATVDSLLTMWATAALLAIIRFAEHVSSRRAIVAGGLVGLAVGTKSSAILLLVPLLGVIRLNAAGTGTRDRNEAVTPIGWWLPLISALALFAVTNPYALLSWPSWVASVWAEQGMARGQWLYPFTQQFRLGMPVLEQLNQQGRWALGWPLALLVWSGTLFWIGRVVLAWRSRTWTQPSHELRLVVALLSWVVPYVGITLTFFARFPRYLLPALPAMLVLGGAVLALLPRASLRLAIAGPVLGATLLWSVGLSHIYTERHPWLSASEWIYETIPAGDTIVQESWDQGIPVPMIAGSRERVPADYFLISVDPYEPDGERQRVALASALEGADWVALSSPRAWRILSALPDFPAARRYYRGLFDGSLGFEVARVWRVDGRLGDLTIGEDPFMVANLAGTRAHGSWLAAQPAPYWWNPGPADESLSVYDHPTVILLRKVRQLSTAELIRLLSDE